MKRILIIIPDISKSGGTERAGINLANMLAETEDCQVSIVSLSDETVKPFYDINNYVQKFYINLGNIPQGIFGKLKWFYIAYQRLKKIVVANKLDIVIGLGHNVNSILALLDSKNLLTIGCEHIDYNTIPSISKMLMRYTYPKLSMVVVLSEVAKKTIQELHTKIEVIPNALPFEAKCSSPLNQKRILMIGRLSPEKGYERVLPLAIFLKDKYPEWRIDIFGDGELYQSLKEEYNSYNLDNVKLNKATKNIKEEYLNSTILLSTSYNEAMPMVFLEAMSCGVPVVSYRHQGAESLINHKKDGIIVDSEHDLLLSFEYLIKNEQVRTNMALNGKKKSEQFSIENIKQKWLVLLNING